LKIYYCFYSFKNSIENFQLLKLHLIRLSIEQEQIERYGGDHVDQEPSLEVVDGNFARMRHHLVVFVDVRRPEVDDDVHDEHDVHNQVQHFDRLRVPVVAFEVLLKF